MGTILGTEILNRVAAVLFDIAGVQWNRTELLGWLNDGQRQITLMVPESTSLIRATVPLAAGTEQNIPSDGWMLIDVYRNMGPSPYTTPGAVLRLIDKKQLDAYDPSWHTDTAVQAPTNWIFDNQSVTQWWCYPPADGTGSVEINYSQVPADLASETLPISLNNIFETALIDYILYRACMKQTKYSPGPEKGAAYWEAFKNSLVAKTKAEMANDPNDQLARPRPGDEPRE